MFMFVLCLFTSSILNGEYGGAFGQSYAGALIAPIDFNDDFNNRNILLKPNDNFIFNFEQIRKDQPPQVEHRNENIGKYMNRKPNPTTAMTVLPIMDNFPSMNPLPNVPTPTVPTDKYNNHWNHVSAFPPTIPPPPSTPIWADLSEILNKQTFPHYETPKQATPSFNHNQPHYPSVLPAHYQPYVPAPVPELPAYPAPNFNQDINRQVSHMPSYKPQEHILHQEHNVPPVPPQLPTSRGSHKFGWNDVTTENRRMTTIAPPATTVGHNNRNPPPSFPTLSPWMDGFGK